MIELLQEICAIVVPLALGALTTFAIKLINQKIAESKSKTDSEQKRKYLDMLNETIVECIKATNQTYVNNLKDKNMFDKEAQLNALKKTTDSVMTIIKGDAEDYLRAAVGDLETLVQEKIEANIEEAKK
jgi:hypothetical protein